MQANLLAFFEGGVTYAETEEMPVTELLRLQQQAVRINKERRKEMNRGR